VDTAVRPEEMNTEGVNTAQVTLLRNHQSDH
jgi:hypothetical protein